jgi:glucokinase
MYLAGDIGGTKVNLALYPFDGDPLVPLQEASYPSAEFEDPAGILREMLKEIEAPIHFAALGVAGPVVEGRARITNLGWVIEEGQLAGVLGGAEVRLLNDLEAIANAIPVLRAGDVHTLQQGEKAPRAAIAVIAPGTGLGEAFLTWDGQRYVAHPSEGGHADFAPRTSQQIELLQYMLGQYEHVSYERLASGMGLPNIFAFLRQKGDLDLPGWLEKELQRAEDPTPVIVRGALGPGRTCELCKRTVQIWVSIVGAEAGNLALKALATGGVYVGGGMPPRMLSAFEDGLFLDSMRAKGRFSDLMSKLPVHVILNPKAALFGAARYAFAHGPRPSP